jgi:hypothetical protein
MEDLMTPVLSRRMTQMKFNSPTFGSSCSTHPLFAQSDFLQNNKSFAMCPFQWMTGMTLGPLPSKILVPSHFVLPKVTSLQSAGSDNTCLVGLDDSDLFWLFGSLGVL